MKNNLIEEDPVLRTVETYSNFAIEFAQRTQSYNYFPVLQGWADKFLSLLYGKSILDIGFGSGRDLLYFESKGFTVVGIDLTKQFIDRITPITKSTLYEMDMRYLLFDKEKFNGLWCCSSFFHLQKEDALSTLTGFKDVLMDKGILYTSIKEGTGSIWRKDDYSQIREDYRFFSYYTVDEISLLLENAGFSLIEISIFPDSRPFRPNWINIFAKKV